ncbi:glycosyltransferase family 4 protein [Kibdelosporangium persicum]|uniref:Glycosyltransferase involved in cell wall bisynthesis n=2 Tax=Kibdelosporangium persicum TaxID=2698649 RepID=A0ABX2FD45_9PSEU|nr:Glycosyltransferase involved in cell wall bisynthesis [Kibdelosporangium persicum]
MRAYLELSHGLHPAEWSIRHARGEVPDHWPYGLDRMVNHGVQPIMRIPARGRVVERIGRAARHRLGGYEWADAFRRNTGDVILCWDEYSGVPAALRERRKPVITGVVWLTDEVDRTTAWFAKRALPRAARVWASSSAMIPRLERDWGVRKAQHIPLGIDVDFFQARPRTEEGLVVSAGNDRHRDHGTLIRAVTKVPGARLEIATRLPIPQRFARIGLNEGQIRDLYHRASVVAIATTPNVHASGLTVTLEAMASGRPVVIPDTPGLTDYVENERTGLVYPVGDEDALAKCVQRLLGDDAMAEEMGRAARRKVEQHFSTELQAARLAELIRTT